MNTEELIASLGAGLTPVRRGALTRGLLAALGGGLLLSVLLFMLFWRVRTDPGSILHDLPLLAKTALPLLLGCLAVPSLLALARPAGRTWATRALAVVPVGLILLMLANLAATPVDGWPMSLRGKSIATCLISIPVLAVPILVALLVALRRGAPVRPALAGGAAGLTSAGFAAAIYSLYCVENAPLFYGTWYTLAVLGVACAGAAAGRFLLRW